MTDTATGWVGPGGEEFDPEIFDTGNLRADLCAIAQRYSFPNGTKFVDVLLDRYAVTRRSLYKNRVD